MKILAVFLLSLISILLCSCNKVHISDLTWERIGHNDTVIRNKDGKIIVDPGNIEMI